MKLIDLTGQKFGRLTVLERAGTKGHEPTWLCACECGNTKVVMGVSLRNGDTLSCGCLGRELSSERLVNNPLPTQTHGLSETRLYKILNGMKSRCYNPKSKYYNDYGGRGIAVCGEWLNDFRAFYDWAIANGYRDDLEIERIDNDGDYEPSNCRWATRTEQNNNKRNNHFVTYNNRTQTVAQWARETGIPKQTLLGRLKRGWNAEKTLTTKLQNQ